MRTHTSSRSIPLLAATCLLILTCSVLANAQDVQRVAITQEAQRSAAPIQIGTVIPQGREFRVELNEEQLSKAYPQYAAQQVNGRRGQPVSREEFRRYTWEEVLRKLRTLFPTGLPEDVTGTSRIKITVTVKFKPPEVGVSVEW